MTIHLKTTPVHITEADVRAAWVPGNPNDRSIRGFRIRHGNSRGPMSKQKYQSLKDKGRGPDEIRDGNTVIIPVEAEARWNRERAAPQGAEARLVAREDLARRQRAKAAARRGVESRKDKKK
jgi:hypothetical protein